VTEKNESNPDSDGDPAKAARYLRASALGFQLVITFAVLAFGGIWLDQTFATRPWGTLGGILFAMVAMVAILQREGGGTSRADGSKESQEEMRGDRTTQQDDEKEGEEE